MDLVYIRFTELNISKPLDIALWKNYDRTANKKVTWVSKSLIK